MATATQFRRIALALEGTTEAPHFDRTAFKVRRTYATLAADGKTANLKFSADEQLLKCTTAADVFAPVPGGWGAQGWTTAQLSTLPMKEVENALRLACAHAVQPTRRRR